MAGRLAPIDPAAARRWKPFVRGPREQWLSCEGALPARLASALHYAWPFARGQWRMGQLLGKLGWPALRAVPFRSGCGVRLVVDIASEDFRHLSGRLAPEPLEVAVMARLVKPGDVFIDVGAHDGLYILHVLGRLGEAGLYFAFEPSPTRFAFLQRAFAGAGERLRLFNAALADEAGEASLVDEGSSTAYLGEGGAGAPVRVARLDEMLDGVPLEGRAIVMKIDTEGHEARVIRGCAGLASRGVRPVFLVEFLPAIHGQTRVDVIGAIEAVFSGGYRYFGIDEATGTLAEFFASQAVAGHVRNALAVPLAEAGRLGVVYGEEPGSAP
ncbi:MAG TPA: FkbM family methyltransferase [Usitatibacter sp.]|jgi:FkbM family methyltransferase|nr:FkbM family methyltransferase [Usitatibacter sp.]